MRLVNIHLVSTSPMASSRSRTALAVAAAFLREMEGVEVHWTDLREIAVDTFPGPSDHAARDVAVETFNAADAVIIGVPVHCWGPASNAVAFLAHALDPKRGTRYRPFLVVGGAGGRSAHLALDGIVRTLLTEIDAVVVGKPVMVAGDDVDLESKRLSKGVKARLHAALEVFLAHARVAGASS